jgi:feruloyl-CoA synthase
MTGVSAAPFRPARVGGALHASVERRADATVVLRSTEALLPYTPNVGAALAAWAERTPRAVLAARRDPAVPGGGDWVGLSYADMLERAQRIGQALLDRGLSAERPLAILSDNDLEHLSLSLGALWAGVPFVPISPAYSLVSQDHGKLRHIVRTVTPGMVFASGPEYAGAISAVADSAPPGLEVVLARGALAGRAHTPFATLLDTPPAAEVAAAHAAIGEHSIAKFLFTSGSTKNPKGVINTHGMLCANQQMLRQTFAFVADEPPVLVDWLPWNHTFGGNHNIGLVLFNGGTLYIDEGKPTPAGMATTLRNLRDVSPSIYFNVPKGFEEIASAMESDTALRERFFSKVKLFMYAGAGLAPAVWHQLERLAVAATGTRIAMLTGLGMTETAPACIFATHAERVRSGHLGLPCPGVEVKLVPEAGGGEHAKTEVRFRGPNVMPGYWREPGLTAEAFDHEGYYRTGDAVRWVNAQDPQQGLMFDGRLAEDFKLSSGTFVSVGPLRAKIAAAASPLVQDAVVAGLDRAEIGVLLIARWDECRKHAGLPANDTTPPAELLARPELRAFFQRLVQTLWDSGSGSANRVARLVVLTEPPSIDKGEVTDKGSINQRAVLAHRAALVHALYDGTAEQLFLPQR